MSKSQDPVPLPEGVSIRPTTLADKDEALNVLDSVNDHGDGRERLPAYYDYLISLPEVKGFGLYMDEKMVRFILLFYLNVPFS